MCCFNSLFSASGSSCGCNSCNSCGSTAVSAAFNNGFNRGFQRGVNVTSNIDNTDHCCNGSAAWWSGTGGGDAYYARQYGLNTAQNSGCGCCNCCNGCNG